MNYVTVHQETDLLICKECKFALIPSRINTHFSGRPYQLNPGLRRQIEIDISHIDDLVKTPSEIEAKIQSFLETFDNTYSIPELAIYSDGLACSYCSFISRSRVPIQEHLKDIHDWENPRKRGQRKKNSLQDPWEINVPCQRFFKSDPEKQYFRVNSIRASPIRIPTRPRVERSRRERSSSS